ncbi:MAG: TonB family protein [Candidatus Coatesbacteria bacterium]|nr:TonB family protein [Candidatus Coatesbacteria bacterium]
MDRYRCSRMLRVAALFLIAAAMILVSLSCSCPLNSKSETPAAKAPPQPSPSDEVVPKAERESGERSEVYSQWEVSEPPELIREVPPIYPPEALPKGNEAIVVLRLVVDENGDVAGVEVLHTKARRFRNKFKEAAIAAAWEYKFKPAKLLGKPVPCTAKVTFRFRIK